MHGRLKVKTTAEQQEAKRKEREKKLQIYRATTTKIFDKRKKNELDDEMMTLTGELLSNVPEFYTLWNIRRELMDYWAANKSSEDMEKVYERELYFLEQCLRMNPKCYSTWNQRCWVMDRMQTANWTRELALCTKFLEYDERNFHCWDYRRFVVERSKVAPAAELEFTTDKISANFSNFSSWHYRSKLLPVVHPDQSHPTGVCEEALLHEFDLVQNAFFTDPNDQSAWFYHRWLLGQGQQKLNIVDVYVNRDDRKVFVVLNRLTKLQTDSLLSVTVNAEKIDVRWCSASGEDIAALWIGDLSSLEWEKSAEQNLAVSLRKVDGATIECEVNGKLDEVGCYWMNADKSTFRFTCELNTATAASLNTELDSCRQLHELEPDNKWVMLTLLSLMRALDSVTHRSEMLSYLDKLVSVDMLRTNYYTDLRSRILMEVAIESLSPGARNFSLTGDRLSSACHLEHLCMMTSVDLSDNALRQLGTGYQLQSAIELNLSSNNLVDCRGLENLSKLETINLSKNDIKETKDLISLASCPRLRTIYLKDNPVVHQTDFADLSFYNRIDLT